MQIERWLTAATMPALALAACQSDRGSGEAVQSAGSSAASAPAAGSLPRWISDEDYPMQARSAGVEGTVRLALEFGSDGRLTRCTTLASSGSSLLDATVCRILMRRARVRPDQPRTHVYEHQWRLPSPS